MVHTHDTIHVYIVFHELNFKNYMYCQSKTFKAFMQQQNIKIIDTI